MAGEAVPDNRLECLAVRRDARLIHDRDENHDVSDLLRVSPVPPHHTEDRRAAELRELQRFDDVRADVAHGVAATDGKDEDRVVRVQRSEEHTSELQSLMRLSYAVFC